MPTDPVKLTELANRLDFAAQAEEACRETGAEETPQLRLEAAMRGLTERERDCFTLAHGQGHSYAEIAELLGITKSSVGTYLLRAQRKINDNVAVQTIRIG